MHMNATHAVFHRPFSGLFGRLLRSERRRFARALEPRITRGCPRHDVSAEVRERDDGVVERTLDVCHAVTDVLALLAAPAASRLIDLRTFFLPATVLRGPLRVRAFVCVR